MRNSWTAKAALLVIATIISFSSPATRASEPLQPKDADCDSLLEDARVTCEVLRAGAETASNARERVHAKSVAGRLCKRWASLAAAECQRTRPASK